MFNKQNKISHNLNRAFTLVEILVAIAAGVVIIALIYASHSLMVRLTERESRKVELVQNGRVTLDRLTRELRQTDEIVTALPETPDNPDDPPPSEIKFQDGHESDPIRYIRYYLDGNLLHREISHYYFDIDPDTWVHWDAEDEYGDEALHTVDEDNVIAEYIDSLIFWGEDRLINIRFDAMSGEESVEFLTAVCGRNLR